MTRYQVQGSVMLFGRCVGTVKKETIAASSAKAKSNVLYQVKREMNINSGSKLSWSKDVKIKELEVCY